MAAVLLEYLADSKEPLTVDDVKSNSRIMHAAEDALIENIIIPAARKLAEGRTGAAIRPARYSDVLPSLGRYPLSLGKAYEVETVEVAGQVLGADAYSLVDLGREQLIDAPGFAGATAKVTFKAGIPDMKTEPGVRAWLLLAAGWFYAQRELFVKGEAVQEMPRSFADGLLDSISQPTRF